MLDSENEVSDESEKEIVQLTENVEETARLTESEPKDIYVDVCGAVSNPGVYRLSYGSRIYQAIEAAGGLTAEAVSGRINQAQILQDEEQVYVPRQEDIEVLLEKENSKTAVLSDGRVNLNLADVGQLMTLNGIGETRANAILAYREEHGSFTSVEEIMNVDGIKEGTYTKIKDQIVVE